MRITNGMIKNNMLNSLYKNVERLDTLYNQMNTQKKIQRASDDPIIAGRGLKLRINVLESKQHESNVKEAAAWMDVTETALTNVNKVLQSMREKLNQAANGTLEPEDKKKLLNDIEELYKQVQQEANVTYAGRYVFSGYKTDEPVVLTKETTLKKDTVLEGDLALSENTVLKGQTGTPPAGGTILAEGTVLKAGTSFSGPDITINGETYRDGDVLADDITIPAGGVPASATEITAAKGSILKSGSTIGEGTTLSKGTLNPEVLGKIDGQKIEYEIGVGANMDINTLGMPEYVGRIMEDMQTMIEGLKKAEADPDADIDLEKMFTGMLGEFDEHIKDLSAMTAELGSKQARLEHTETRLSDNTTNLTELLSNTEGVELEEVYVEYSAQFMVYQSALQATSKVIMPNLAQFLG